jgi:Tfp pilus assembly protein PilP
MTPIVSVILFLVSNVVAGQAPPPQTQPGGNQPAGAVPAAAAQASTPAQTPAQAPTQPPARPSNEPYTYSAEGRRDPFVNLLGTGGETRVASRRTEGPATMAVADISVRGIMQSRGGLVAMVQGPDNKTYIVHQGDKFLDGTLKSITAQSLVIVQDVSDPLSLVKHREVRKQLRSLEDVKE